MTSKNLFFNLMKENAKRRLWTIAMSFLVFIFIFPVAAALIISDWTRADVLLSYENTGVGIEHLMRNLFEEYQQCTSVQNGAVISFIILFAIVCGVSGFSYLHSKKKIDFFHSVPVRREKLFAAAYVNGVLFIAVPYFICLMLGSLMIQIKTGIVISWGGVLSVFLIHMAFYLLLYSTVILAVMLTGNTIVSLLGTAVFFSWVPAVISIAVAYCEAYFKTYFSNDVFLEKIFTRGSPFAWYIYSVTEEAATVFNAWMAVLVALILSALAVLLYRLRPSEAAGRAMAFKKSELIIKLILVVPMALFSGFFFGEMKNTDSWSIFGLVCGLIISYCIIEIIYHFDFRQLFSHKKQLALSGVITFAFFAFFRFDMMGYDTYLPSESQVESCGIYTDHFDDNVSYNYIAKPYLYEYEVGNHYLNWRGESDRNLLGRMKLTDTKSVMEIARLGIEGLENDEKRSDRYSSWNRNSASGNERIRVVFRLKSGRTVYRNYYSVNSEKAEAVLDGLYDQREYKTAVYPILEETASNLAGINYKEQGKYSHVSLPDEVMKEKLLTVYQEELSGLTASLRKQESPIAAIQFKTNQVQEMIDTLKAENSNYFEFNERNYYPVYPSFTKTIALLEECGVNPGEYLGSHNVSKIEIAYTPELEEEETDFYSQKEYAQLDYDKTQSEPEVMIIDDARQMVELLKSCISADSLDMNVLNPVVENIVIIAYVPQNKIAKESKDFVDDDATYERTDVYNGSEDLEEFRLYLDADQVPEFVRNRFPGISD